MADNARGVHVSPGIYTREIDMSYAIKSLGITTLGLVGETQRGPAFQPMDISNWREFQETFGGTSTEKFKGSQYPKYELPYIAKSYLSESEQLKVVRVLGLGGYNAGPAWVVTASIGSGDVSGRIRQAVAVIRSRGTYYPYYTGSTSADCICETTKYDTLIYKVGQKEPTSFSASNQCYRQGFNMKALQIREYVPIDSDGNECTSYKMYNGTSSWDVSETNKGRFKLVGVIGTYASDEEVESIIESKKFESGYFEYPVSLNPYDKEYILNVLGTKAYDGEAPIYVESLYDVALEQGIANGEISHIDSALTFYDAYYTADYCHHAPIYGIVDKPQTALRRKDVGRRYLADYEAASGQTKTTCVPFDVASDSPVTYMNVWDPDTRTNYQNTYDYLNQDGKKHPEPVAEWTATWEYSGKTGTSESGKSTSYTETKITYWSGNTKYEEPKPKEFENYEICDVTSALTINCEMYEGVETDMAVGQIYTVKQHTTADGKRHYYYGYYDYTSVSAYTSAHTNIGTDAKIALYGNLLGGGYITDSTSGNSYQEATLVLNNADGLYYKVITGDSGTTVGFVKLDMNDYKSAYRYASTPWIVSNLKGDYNHIELTKLFRFHTISDGDNANYEVKVSIENIRPDDGTFDVVVRRIDDLDESIIPLEKFGRCSMVPGDSNYIAYQIGSFDGVYESKSKFITVEVNETTAARTSVPAGFLGYPIPLYNGEQIVTAEAESGSSSGVTNSASGVTFPTIMYNRMYDDNIKNRKQYFGLSSWVGVDVDNFTFKGNKAYINDPIFLSHGFHLDSRLDITARRTKDDSNNEESSASVNGCVPSSSSYKGTDLMVTVDGEEGYEFDSVSTNSRTQVLDQPPIIDKESKMYGSIYEYVNLRKFTVFFYGGFDGWDVYRDQRTNTDNFKMSQYRGYVNQKSGEGYSFNMIENPDLLQLNQNGITSDWYAYLSGIRQFSNPEATDINVLATPGIDYVNQKLLVEEAIEMIEEERADSIYVVTTPDKPSGAGDYVDEMYTPEDAVYNLEDTEIDSNYTCTYYPWVKYLDTENNQYIYLPATKDVVRNFAQTDNQAYPWFAPAGIERGNVDCVRAHYITKLGDEDVLYEGRINPVKTFAQDGPKIWGQKNLQINESQLNRIAVRRLLLRLRKLIAISCIGLIFEPNDATTKQSFISTVTPILDSIRSNRGISDYRIEVNDTLESRERRELPAKIYFKPYNALEYITIDFILTPEGVSFDDI